MRHFVPSRCSGAAFLLLLVACVAPQPAAGAAPDRLADWRLRHQPSAQPTEHRTGPPGRGMLLAIGGGLDDDNAPVFERFLEVARGAWGKPQVVVMTAATGDQDVMAAGKFAALQTWSPNPLRCIVVKRETPTADTVAAIDAATALFFTGGDQKRIVERYRPGDAETPEWQAMQRLLLRGGVIAGSSAGLAMMGDTMLLGGTSAEALGVSENGGGDAPAGPQIGAGMHFLPHVITDTHFFERNRVGRLVAALEAAGERFGIAVGEDGAVEIDIGLQTATGIAVSEALLVDTGAMTRDGDARRGIVAVRIARGQTVSLQQF